MKTYKKILSILVVLALSISCVACGTKTTDTTSSADNTSATDSTASKTETKAQNFNIVSSFYPMHILAQNLVKGIDSVTEKSMSDPNMGCIHDHTFTTEDLKKIENANAYIENGMGLEVFNDKVKEAYPDTVIIEACTNITDAPKDDDEVNPHVWTNVDDYIKQIKYVSSQLQEVNPANKEAYAKNESEYVEKLEKLKSDYSDKLSKIAGKKALVLDETLPSFCVYTKIETYDIKTDHEQESISAQELKETIDEMNKNSVKTILIAKDSDRSNAEAIAKETGATIYELNSCMVGDTDADSYLNYMKENFDIISTIE